MYRSEHIPAGYFSADKLEPKEVVLTFDDGPAAGTPQILDLLKKHGVKATFFVCGNAITAKNYQLIRRMLDEGHLLGNHTLKHIIGLPGKTEKTIDSEYAMNQAVVDIALSATSGEDFAQRKAALLAGTQAPMTAHPYRLVLTRPTGGDPYIHGRWGADLRARYTRVLEKQDSYTVLWNAESRDSDGSLPAASRKNPRIMADSVLRWLKPGGTADKNGAVILMHDRIPVDAVRIVLEEMNTKNTGLKVVGLDAVIARKYNCAETAPAHIPES